MEALPWRSPFREAESYHRVTGGVWAPQLLIQPPPVPGTEVEAGHVLGEATPARTGRVVMAERKGA